MNQNLAEYPVRERGGLGVDGVALHCWGRSGLHAQFIPNLVVFLANKFVQMSAKTVSS